MSQPEDSQPPCDADDLTDGTSTDPAPTAELSKDTPGTTPEATRPETTRSEMTTPEATPPKPATTPPAASTPPKPATTPPTPAPSSGGPAGKPSSGPAGGTTPARPSSPTRPVTAPRPVPPTATRPAGVQPSSGASTPRPPSSARPTPARPAPTPAKAAPARASSTPSIEYEADDEDYDDYPEESARWVGLVVLMGVGLLGVVAAQVTAAIIEGFMVRSAQLEPTGIETDFLHRIGFPFGNLGPLAALFLVVGLVLVSLPHILNEETTELQDRLVGIALNAIIVLAVILAIGSLLAVRHSLHEYTGRNANPPPFARVGFGSFLLGTLGTAAVALFGAFSMRNARKPLD